MVQSTISKRYSSMAGLVRTSLEMSSNCFLSFFAVPAVGIEDEKFSLADVFHGGVAEAGKSVVDRLTLGIENGARLLTSCGQIEY